MTDNLITIRLSAGERAKLVKRAEEKGSTLSAVAREAITASLKQGDLETRIAVAVQAEVRSALDWFLDNYQQAQAGTADALSEVLSGIVATTKQAIAPPKAGQDAEAIRAIQARAREEAEQAKARFNQGRFIVPSGDDDYPAVHAHTSAPPRK